MGAVIGRPPENILSGPAGAIVFMSGVQWQWLHSISVARYSPCLRGSAVSSGAFAGFGPGPFGILRPLFGATVRSTGLIVRRNATSALASSSVIRP